MALVGPRAVVAATAASMMMTAMAQMGPGKGPWETVRPESVGLSESKLNHSESEVNRLVAGRNCFLVVKDGKIVYEKYRRDREVDTITESYSISKTMCASLYGIAVEQGWAAVTDRITNRDWNPRQCNKDAIFQNVLTQTGMSEDLNNPTFIYDYTGLECLDVLQDFIRLNNPDGYTSAVEWKDRHWQSVLGMEHTIWGNLGYLNCGFSAELSCRDAARFGQLWVNNGYWPGFGQLMNEEYAKKGRTSIYPHMREAWGGPYGYTLWLWAQNQHNHFDETVVMAGGSGAQCIWMSQKYNAVIVSFGYDENDEDCDFVWQQTRLSIVPAGHPMENATFTQMDMSDRGQRAKVGKAMQQQQLPKLREYLLGNIHQFSSRQLSNINQHIVSLGGKPVPIPTSSNSSQAGL